MKAGGRRSRQSGGGQKALWCCAVQCSTLNGIPKEAIVESKEGNFSYNLGSLFLHLARVSDLVNRRGGVADGRTTMIGTIGTRLML